MRLVIFVLEQSIKVNFVFLVTSNSVIPVSITSKYVISVRNSMPFKLVTRLYPLILFHEWLKSHLEINYYFYPYHNLFLDTHEIQNPEKFVSSNFTSPETAAPLAASALLTDTGADVAAADTGKNGTGHN